MKKKENAKNTEQKRNRKKDDNTGSLRREDNHANQFSEFDVGKPFSFKSQSRKECSKRDTPEYYHKVVIFS